MDLEVVEELVGGLFWPFHQVEEVVDVRSAFMFQWLGCMDVEVLEGPMCFDHKALFWFQYIKVFLCGRHRRMVCISKGTMGIYNGLVFWLHV